MKIIIPIALIDESSERFREALEEASVDLTIPDTPVIEMARLAVIETADLKHTGYTLNEDESELTLEISDELILKYTNVYVKIVKAVLPFVKPAIAIFHSLLDDIQEIGQMLTERK